MTRSSTSESIDVHVIYSIPSPYQEKLFELVTNREGMNLHVYYCEGNPSDRDWDIDSGAYSSETLSGSTVRGQYFNTEIVRKLGRSRPDVLVVGGYSHPTMQLGMIRAKMLGIPIVLWNESHGRDWRNQNPSIRTRVKDVLLSQLVKHCSAFLVPGGLQRQYLEAHGAPGEAIFSGTHTCDIDSFSQKARKSDRTETLASYGVSEENVLTFVGRLIEKKGLTELVDAAAIVSGKRDDVGFVIAGSGPLEDELKERCRRLGLANVYFPGFVSRSELPALYGASDVFVFPSGGDPWGVVVNEAMACGLPVITTDAVGASLDLVNDGINGAIVPPNDEKALASAIQEVISSDYEGMGKRSSQIIDEWTHEDAADSFLTSVQWSLDAHDTVVSQR